jgi:hypothetical protein
MLSHLRAAPDPVYEPEPVYAYVFITLHGYYSFEMNDPSKLPRNLSDLPSEPYLEPLDTFTLNETGIKTLKWIRAVPGGVCNYTYTHKGSNELDEYYAAVKKMARTKTLDIPRDIFNRTSTTAIVDYLEKKQSEKAKDFLKTLPKHYEEITFLSDRKMINKIFSVTQQEMSDPGNPLNRKIFLMNNTETYDITTQVLKKTDDNYYVYIKDLLTWLKNNGYEHVLLVDLTCAVVFVGEDILSDLTVRSLFFPAANAINFETTHRNGGKKKNTQTRRKKLKRGKTRKHKTRKHVAI